MRILVFLSQAEGGGAQRRLSMLARGFAARGHDVDFVTAAPLPPGFALPGCRVVGLEVTAARHRYLRHRRLLWVPRAAPALARLLAARRPDVLLTTSLPATLTALAVRRRAAPEVAVVASVNLLPSLRMRWPPAARAVARGWGRILRAADAVVAISHGLADALRALLAPDGPPVTAVPNPVDVEAIRRRAAAPPPFRLAGEGPLLVACGKLERQKDHATLLRAFARLRRLRPARLLVLGEGRCRPRLERLARRLGIADAVRLPGFVPDPFPVLGRADLFVHSSRFEGLGNVLLEALACGRPVVATDCPFGPREVLADGAFGRLVPPGDPDALAEAMARTLDAPPDPAHQRRRAADFAPERAVAGYLAVLEAAVARRRGGAAGARAA